MLFSVLSQHTTEFTLQISAKYTNCGFLGSYSKLEETSSDIGLQYVSRKYLDVWFADTNTLTFISMYGYNDI